MKDISDFITAYDKQGISALIDPRTGKAVNLPTCTEDEEFGADLQNSLREILHALKEEELCLAHQKEELLQTMQRAQDNAKACLAYIGGAKTATPQRKG